MLRKKLAYLNVLVIVLLAATTAFSQARITTPREFLGFDVGQDYHLANYTQLSEYMRKLDQESDRLSVVEIGKTAEGRPMIMTIVTSPANHQNLARYKDISRRLALAEGLTDEQASALAAEGKTTIMVYAGIHANEVVAAQHMIESVYQMVSRTDPETMRFLNDVIYLGVPMNPDGMELVSNWYMREPEPTKRSNANLPVLYHKYVGHDNNRDWFMSAMPENEAVNRTIYREWFPQIVYTHHQSGPAGTIMFCAPFRDPFNYNFDPLVVMGVDTVGAAMHSRFIAEGKPGVTMRSGANYSTWWNGGDRTSPYFHNMIGILTEVVGSPNPMNIPLVPSRQLPKNDLSMPIAPQLWHARQSIEYEVTANRAVFDIASRLRDTFLMNIYRMGKNSIERGSKDSWTISPRKVAAMEAASNAARGLAPDMVVGGNQPSINASYYDMLRDPADRDARGYIIPSDQPDFLTAVKFVNTLLIRGVTVHRATAAFTVNGKNYPAGSLVVKTAQAFRPHILDMFEPQDHPDDFAYPGGPPKPPYDSAGWTLAYLMGVKFDRVLEGFNGPFEVVPDVMKAPAGSITQTSNAVGYLLTHEQNDAFIAVNRLLHSNEEVFWVKNAFTLNGRNYPAGTHYITAKPTTLAKLQKLTTDVGLKFEATAAKPRGEGMMLRPMRIGLWDRFGGSMPSGWTRSLLEKFEFPFTVVYPKTLDEGNLSQKFDVLIFVDGAIPDSERNVNTPNLDTIPAQYHDSIGAVTVSKTIPHLKTFVEDGGTLLAIGGSTSMGTHAGLPIMDALVQRAPNGTVQPLPETQFYVPGSVLQARVDNTNPLAFGLGERVDLFYDMSPVFNLAPDAIAKGVKPVAWFDSATPLRSGWAWGQAHLKDSVAVIDATLGKGKLVLFGPEIVFRSQPHGTFKFLFNGIYYGRTESVQLGPQ